MSLRPAGRASILGAIILRELRGYFFSPLAWVVLTLFLLVQGYGFYLLVELCNHPKGPPGSLIQYFFGGSFFYWLFVISLTSLLTMRLLAGERRQGTLDLLLAAPVGEVAIVLGKFFAALVFYAFLWAPTVVHLIIAARLGSSADPGPAAGGYVGTLSLGAAALSLGLLCSSLTRSQLLAGLASFALLGALLLLGPLDLFVQSPWLKELASTFNLFDQMESFSRGLVDSRHLVLYASLTIFGLAASVVALRRGRVRGLAPRAALGLGLLLLNLVLINHLAAGRYSRWDWTSDRSYALTPGTLKVLEGIRKPVKAYLFMVPPDRLEPSSYHRVKEVLDRFGRRSAYFTSEQVDIDSAPTRAEVLARRFAIGGEDLRRGVVVLEQGERTRHITSSAMASIDYSVQPARLMGFRGEVALLQALVSLLDPRPRRVCFSKGHGEAPIDSYEKAGYGLIADEVRRDGYTVRSIDSAALLRGAPGCTVLVIGGPSSAFASAEVDALDRFLGGGGRLLLLVGPVLDRRASRHRKLGLEQTMAQWGVKLPHNILVDRLRVPGEQALLTWATRDGYGRHPVARAMAGRITVWPLSREVRPLPGAMPGLKAAALVSTSREGWAETDLASLRGDRPLLLDREQDTPGPVPVAAAVQWRKTRLVVLGSERGVLNRRLGGQKVQDFNQDLVLAAVAWLSGQDAPRQRAGQPHRSVRAMLDQDQLRKLFMLVVLVMPLGAVAMGLLVWWRRRS